MDDIPKYIKVKNGEEKPDYLHPMIKHILEETFGIMVYQEQVMQIAQVLSGFTLGGADLLRRAMGKKIKSEMEAQRKVFIEGAVARDVPAARTIKLEDPPTPYKTSRILEQAKDLNIAIFGGLGGVFLLEELMAGAAGAMTGFAFPAILVKIVSLFRAGTIDEAADVFYASVPLMRFEFQEGIGMAIRKEVLRRRGAIAHAGIRAPGGTLDETTMRALDRVLAWTGQP